MTRRLKVFGKDQEIVILLCGHPFGDITVCRIAEGGRELMEEMADAWNGVNALAKAVRTNRRSVLDRFEAVFPELGEGSQ